MFNFGIRCGSQIVPHLLIFSYSTVSPHICMTLHHRNFEYIVLSVVLFLLKVGPFDSSRV
jgi:hypothetical protein